MKAFANLLDRLVFTPSRAARFRLIGEYLKAAPDPDRGWALAALTGGLDIKAVRPALVRALVEARVDPELFAISRDYIGDIAETCALLWEAEADGEPEDEPRLGEVVDKLVGIPRSEAGAAMAALMDRLDPSGRYALIKLATGALRVGISARLAKIAFADAFGVDVAAVEEVWHGLSPPYPDLFAWGEGRAPQPGHVDVPVFRPFMLAHPLGEGEVDLQDYAAEWKWDGIRVQIVHVGGETRLYSRAGDDITRSFPDVAEAFRENGVADGELLVRSSVQGNVQGNIQGGAAASFSALQQRLGRKSVPARMRAEYPAFVRLYDLLFDAGEDLRELPWQARRVRLEAFAARLPTERFDLSAIVEARDFAHLSEIRESARGAAIEGLMLKRRDSAYVAGRRSGLWYKWKLGPLTADCVLMYAERGHGRRTSLYSDYTFGCWSAEGQLLPVGKASSGFTDEDLKLLDTFVREHTVQRFGPVREVEKTLVLEVAFDSVHESRRHKSGLAMRFPRIDRVRTDKPASEAETIAALRRLAL